MADIEHIRAIPLFADLDDVALGHILERAADFDVPAGYVLVQPNREATGMFVIEEGTAVVEAGEHEFERGPGDSIGELALLTPGALRVALVRAKTPLKGLAISRRVFAELLERHPGMAIPLLQTLARRLAEATNA